MPAPREETTTARRSVVPQAAGQSLWRAAVWTGAGTALLAAVASIAVVAVVWLPVSGSSGSAGSAIRAGLLTFLAALHGGITVGGVHALFVPAGMTLLLGVLAWRAGCGLADVAADLEEERPRTLLGAGALQTAAFAVPCTIAAAAASLGTSSAAPVAVAFASLLLFGSCTGAALVRWSALGDHLYATAPSAAPLLGAAARTAAAALLTYAVGASLLVAGALVVHHGRVGELSDVVGGGWSAVPVLALGLLAAPNAIVAGSSYLAGPGFAVGTGSSVSLVSTTHGTLPAFPVLGALPTGHGASWPVWTLAVLTCLAAGAYAARGARRFGAGIGRWRVLGAAAGVAALAGIVLAWLGGGSVGSAQLSAVGASPWQLGLTLGVEVGVFGAVAMLVADAAALLRRRSDETEQPLLAVVGDAARSAGRTRAHSGGAVRSTGKDGDKLAG